MGTPFIVHIPGMRITDHIKFCVLKTVLRLGSEVGRNRIIAPSRRQGRCVSAGTENEWRNKAIAPYVYYYAPVSVALEFIRAGKLKALSMSSVQRSAALPDVPTSLEAGYAGSDFNLWIGVFAPAGTPPAIAERLNRQIGIALANPTVRDKLANQGVDTMTMGTGEFAAFVKSEVASMAKLAKALNLTPN